MPSLQKFSFKSSVLEIINFDKVPYTLSIDDAVLEIAFKNNFLMVASNISFYLNNIKCYFAKIKTDDLIYINNECIIFNEEIIIIPDDFFLGNFQYNGINSSLFTLPIKVSEQYFLTIDNILKSSLNKKKIFINCNLVSYMDGSALSAMLNLINTAIDKQSEIHFYLPNNKFLSYLQLAKIKKIVPIIESMIPSIEQFIDHGFVKINYFIVNHVKEYIINSKIVNYIGRSTEICSILVEDNQVSRIHSAIIIINNLPYLMDCDSVNQTYINNKKIKKFSLYQLKINDTIILGNSSRFILYEK